MKSTNQELIAAAFEDHQKTNYHGECQPMESNGCLAFQLALRLEKAEEALQNIRTGLINQRDRLDDMQTEAEEAISPTGASR